MPLLETGEVNLSMEKTTARFEQIQHCAVVEYSSPLTGREKVTGVFYKPAWTLAYYKEEKWHHLEVTPSQTCDVVVDALTLCQTYCKIKYPNSDGNQE